MKTNFLLIWTASRFPAVTRLLAPASGPWSSPPPLSAHSPILPHLCVRRIPWGSQEAGGNAGQDAKNRDKEHGNWEKGRCDIQEECACCRSNHFFFPIPPPKDFRACVSISKRIWAEKGMLAQPVSVCEVKRGKYEASAEENPFSIRCICLLPFHLARSCPFPFCCSPPSRSKLPYPVPAAIACSSVRAHQRLCPAPRCHRRLLTRRLHQEEWK